MSSNRICISISLLNSIRPIPSILKEWKSDSPKYVLQDKSWNVGETENQYRDNINPDPEQPGISSVPDPIGPPEKGRNDGPQEEFIEVDPNFTKEMPDEEKEELLRRSREEIHKDS